MPREVNLGKVVGPQGPKGERGLTGATGPQGPVGKSAYQYAVDGGYTGTEAEFKKLLLKQGIANDSELFIHEIPYLGNPGLSHWSNVCTVNGTAFINEYTSSIDEGGSVYTSTDGIQYTQLTDLQTGSYAFAYGHNAHGEFYTVAVTKSSTDKQIYYKKDGATIWSRPYASIPDQMIGIVSCGSHFYIITKNGYVGKSEDYDINSWTFTKSLPDTGYSSVVSVSFQGLSRNFIFTIIENSTKYAYLNYETANSTWNAGILPIAPISNVSATSDMVLCMSKTTIAYLDMRSIENSESPQLTWATKLIGTTALGGTGWISIANDGYQFVACGPNEKNVIVFPGYAPLDQITAVPVEGQDTRCIGYACNRFLMPWDTDSYDTKKMGFEVSGNGYTWSRGFKLFSSGQAQMGQNDIMYPFTWLPSDGGTMSGNIDMKQHRIVNVGSPYTDNDAITRRYLKGENYLCVVSSNTPAATAQKVVTISTARAFVVQPYAIIGVYFQYANTAENPTLKVEPLAPYPIYYNGALIRPSMLSANHTHLFMFLNDRYILLNPISGSIKTNTSIPIAAWSVDLTYTALEYNFRAQVPMAGVTTSHIPEVIFSPEQALSGNLAPFCESYAGGVYLYAKAIPTGDITAFIKCEMG